MLRQVIKRYASFAQRQQAERLSDPRAVVGPTYFTGKPVYHDTLSYIDYNLAKFNAQKSINNATRSPLSVSVIAGLNNNDVKMPEWISLKDLKSRWNVPINPEEYDQFVQRLNALHATGDTELINYASQFYAKVQNSGFHVPDIAQNTPVVDENGRVYACGVRRKLLAHVWLIPSNSASSESQSNTILINGVDYKSVLKNMKDRFVVAAPFHDSLVGEFNVYCKLESAFQEKNRQLKDILHEGGLSAGNSIADLYGNSAIRDALTVGIARAMRRLLLHSKDKLTRQSTEDGSEKSDASQSFSNDGHSIATLLSQVASDDQFMAQLDQMCLADERQRERKKAGQPSARAKHQWVKR
ncbi:hypothetical protein MIR68_002398 [Amoeboaphelidium protococcarum]|nr:hypothetical protein MIR68_002398 [Amoeboaphelidium protococcarum]